MYKILIITRLSALTGAAVHTVVVPFDNKGDAKLAIEAAKFGSVPGSCIINAIPLF